MRLTASSTTSRSRCAGRTSPTVATNRPPDSGLRSSTGWISASETYHALTAAPTYLGTTAHNQGRIAGEKALGATRQFAGSLGTQVVKIFDLAAARTGLRDDEARAAGFDPLTVASIAPDHKPYYPGARDIAMHCTADRATRRLLVGHRSAQIAKRIDVPAAALHAGWTIDHISDLDLSYTPPFGSPWDALQIGSQTWGRSELVPDSYPSGARLAGR